MARYYGGRRTIVYRGGGGYRRKRINWGRIRKNKLRAMANTKRKWLKRGLIYGVVGVIAFKKFYPQIREKLPVQITQYLDKIFI